MTQSSRGLKLAFLSAIPLAAIAFWPAAASQNVPFPKLAIGILLAVFLLLKAKPDRLHRSLETTDLPYIAYGSFVCALLLRTALSELPELGLWGVGARLNGTMAYVVLGIILWAGRDPRLNSAPYTPIYAIVISGLLTTSYAFLQFLGKDVISWSTEGLLSSLGNPDHTASFHATVATAGYWMAADRSKQKWLRFGASIIATLALALTVYWARQTVIQGVGLIVLALFLLITSTLYRSGYRKRLLVVVALVGTLTVPMLLNFAREDRGLQDRLLMIGAGLRMWFSHPIVGVGVGRIQDFYNQYRSLHELSQFGLERSLDDLHSIPIQILAMTGLAGGLPFLLFICVAVFFSWRVLFQNKNLNSEDNLLAILSLIWLAESAFSPDSFPISLAGMSCLSMLVGRQFHKKSAHHSNRGTPGYVRTVTAALLVGALLYRLVIDINFIEVDSRLSRIEQPKSQLRAYVQNEEAVRDLLTAIRRYPPDPYLQTRVARRLGATGFDSEAVNLLLEITKQNPFDFEANSILVRHFQRAGNVAQAHHYARRLTEQVPYSPAVWIERADVALFARDTTDARFSLDSAVTLAKRIPIAEGDFWARVRRLRAVQDSIGQSLSSEK